MRRIALLLALTATASALRAQDPFSGASAAGAATGAAENATATKGAGGTTGARAGATDSLARAVNINSLESGTLLQIINKAFDTNSDSINPESGTMNWKGH